MNPQARNKLIGAIVAAALAIAVYYGLIDQKQANSIQTQTNQTLGTQPAAQQTGAQPPRQPAPAPQATPTAPAAPTTPVQPSQPPN